MLNKNICEDIWLYYLDGFDNNTCYFNKEYNTSYYSKGKYIDNIIIGIYINDNGNLCFKVKEGNSLGWDKVNFRVIENITKDIFPKLDCEEVNKLQNTIVYLRRLRSDLDLCFNNLLGEEYGNFLDDTDDRILEFINISILNIIDYSKDDS